ncbi:MAG: dimethylarginine dimethylaminohydrolase family protein [Tepidanaerobacteraceae bacterium]
MVFSNSEYGRLKRVLLCRPEYLTIGTPINVIAKKNIDKGKDVTIEAACKEHDEFVEAFKLHGVEVMLSKTHKRYPYEVNTRDLGVTTPKGIIFGRYLEPLHWGEHRLAEIVLEENKIPIYHKLDRGLFEGGDFMYIDDKKAAVGIASRTNYLGFEALKYALYDTGLTLYPIEFHKDYLHLDMIFNVIGEKTVILCKEALPDSLIKMLKQERFTIIEITKEEVFLHGCNLLNIGNNVIFSHPQAGNINKKLKSLGFEVVIINLKEVLKSGGGPRCMSFPVERELVKS